MLKIHTSLITASIVLLLFLVIPTEVLAQPILPVSRGGTGSSSFSAGSVLFSDGIIITQNNSSFFWDNINNRLGIGTNSPLATLDVSGNAKISGDLDVTGNITGNVTATNLVPYTGATANVDLGTHNLTAGSLASTNDATINSLTVGLGGGSVTTNTAIGKGALLNSTSGTQNTGVGYETLYASNGVRNTALGYLALSNSNSNSGEENTAVGSHALRSNSTGNYNSALGSQALHGNSTGEFNTAIGVAALIQNTSGSNNTGVGFYALNPNTTGSNNIAVGERAGFWQVNGQLLTTPESSIYIGLRTRGYDDNDSNSIVIGTEAEGAGANKAVIGNSQITDVYFGSSAGVANIHAKKLFLGSSTVPGCIIMGDTAGGVGYITLNSGVLTVSSTPPSACQ